MRERMPPATVRDGKGSLYEAALRVVAFANWPDRIQPGVVGEVMHAVDLYPTLLNLAGAQRGSAQAAGRYRHVADH
jgi:arylsulfatase A-like enzyme